MLSEETKKWWKNVMMSTSDIRKLQKESLYQMWHDEFIKYKQGRISQISYDENH